jgi:transcription initiation factor TFIIB
LNLPDSIEEEVARIYTEGVQRGLVRGRSMEQVVAGTIYITCKRNDLPKTLEEIAEITSIDKKEISYFLIALFFNFLIKIILEKRNKPR